MSIFHFTIKRITIANIFSIITLFGCETVTVQFEFKSASIESNNSNTPTLPLATSNASFTRKALIIGNADYSISKLFKGKSLSNPRNDAQDMAKRLAQYDFNVTTILDVDFATMKSAIDTFTGQLSSHDIALIYYSGHGIATTCNKNDGQKNYLIPIENISDRKDLCRYPITAEDIIDKLTQRGTGTNILILDACRQNLAAAENKGFDTQGFTGIYGGNGTFIGYATAPGQTAIGNSERRNSLYTEILLTMLQPNQDDLPIETLFQQVRTAVVQEANKLNRKQVPWDTNALEESFCFRNPCRNVNKILAQTTPVTKMSTSDAKIPELIVSEYLLPKMVFISGGCFTMDSHQLEEEYSDNEQQEQVCVESFYMGTHEVTNAEFRQFIPYHSSGKFEGSTLDSDDQQPVVNITWHEATEYATWLSEKTGKKFRLPTEAEWEFAVRANNTTAYLSGNILEWTCSAYSTIYTGGEQECPASERDSDDTRVVRGGFWNNNSYKLRSAYRDGWNTSSMKNELGFRLVQEITE
jgi:formylglycine-generating enzyme required for sulfatase activity